MSAIIRAIFSVTFLRDLLRMSASSLSHSSHYRNDTLAATLSMIMISVILIEYSSVFIMQHHTEVIFHNQNKEIIINRFLSTNTTNLRSFSSTKQISSTTIIHYRYKTEIIHQHIRQRASLTTIKRHPVTTTIIFAKQKIIKYLHQIKHKNLNVMDDHVLGSLTVKYWNKM